MTLYDSLGHLLADLRDKDAEIRFIDGEDAESTLTFAALWDEAIALLGALQAGAVSVGQELVIFTRCNRKFVVAFWAAILGGLVPVPVAVGSSDEHRLKLFRILRLLRKPALYTESELRNRLLEFATAQGFDDLQTALAKQVILDDDLAADCIGQVVARHAHDIAFIQFSSGSTSDPKGVCLTHANVTANIRAIVEATGWGAEDRSLSWMPLTHDMGLIGYHLSVLAAGMNHVVMDTNLFVRRPLLWMSKASELRMTQLCSPNFGYKHFMKLFERKGLPDLDLSAVRLILNGAEPISWDLCETFLAALAPFGLKRSVMLPVYGLAEATVAVTVPTPGVAYSRIVVDRHRLRIGHSLRPVDPTHGDAVSFVKVGGVVRDCMLRIADDEDSPLEDGVIGHIQIKGANVTAAIYGDDGAATKLFTDDRWLRTGDCGVMVDGELVVTGRSKDIIIVNGQNYYPHDLEEIIAHTDGLDLGKVVVCGASGESEELIVFLLFRQDLAAFRELAETVRAIVAEKAGLTVDRVIPVTRIPKTTSGKIQRARLSAAYSNGEFQEVIAALSEGNDHGTDSLDQDPLVREIELICRQYSKERAIGPDDNLFEVGVSSLTLTEIIMAIDEKYPGKVDIGDLFQYPTVRELANFLRR